MARVSAIAGALLLIVALAALIIESRPGLTGGTDVTAEFRDVYPLLAGMDVREYGALAGTVEHIDLTDHATVEVKLLLNKHATLPRADATAAVRQQDITGNSYLALEPGHAAAPLGHRPISTARTLVAPRFEDLLNSLDRPVQQGMQIILAQLGITMDRRGQDLNAAALSLRPALAATTQALTEVGSQNRALRALIRDGERVSGQVAGSSRRLAALVDGLAASSATAAAHAPGLDRALALAPQAADAAAGTLRRLTRVALAGRPLARTLGRAAPTIARTATLIGPFLANASPVLDDAEPTLALLDRTLIAAEPTLAAAPKRALTAPFDVAGSAGRLLNALLGNKELLPALFGATGYGKDAGQRVGLGALGVESGAQRGYPAGYDARRVFLRAVAILSCESFGVPVRAGCSAALPGAHPRRASTTPTPPRRSPPHPARRVLDQVTNTLGSVQRAPAQMLPNHDPAKTVHRLLDFLLKP